MMANFSSDMEGFAALEEAELREAEAQEAERNSLHPGVRCDGCKEPIGRKLRYKCFTCPNYDLCAQCRKYGAGEHGPTGAADLSP